MGWTRREFVAGAAAVGAAGALGAQKQQLASPPTAPPQKPLKRVLAWGDVQTGYQHDSVSHALSVMEQMGRERGLFELTIHTDSQVITKHEVAGARNVKNLGSFDAIFFMGTGNGTLTAQQKDDLLSFVRDDGKGFVGAHTGIDAFEDWPEYGEMIGGYFDEHPWGQTDGTVLVEQPQFPGWSGLGKSFAIHDEFYQVKAPYLREKVDVIARLDVSKLDMTLKNVRRADKDFPVAWAKTYGKGRVFWSTFGHAAVTWDDPRVQGIYMGALQWALGMEQYVPRPHAMGKI
jgi:type 1 glutamine amidotransferase